MPYIVRRERGVINRAVYDVAVLFDPADPIWEPWDRQAGWNGKVHWLFGGGCRPTYRQGFTPVGVLHDRALSRGFAVASSTLNVFGEHCNDVTSAETVMMVKEHIAETYGEVRWTTAEGGSGGSMQQHLIAANYPGLLDGILPSASYPDLWSILPGAVDCDLLLRYFDGAPPALWADANDRAAVAGNPSVGTCLTWGPDGFNFGNLWLHPSSGCPGGASDGRGRYDAVDNPDGVRCTLQDFMVNVFGRRAEDGFANRPWDNVGVQYGLEALRAGEITAEQFVDLNAAIGAFDLDYAHTAQRWAADEPALRTAYRAGQVTSGEALDETAIIDLRLPLDHEIHTSFHSWSTRERLLAANGHADNHVILTGPAPAMADRAFAQLDRWMAALEADTSAAPRADRVARARPADLATGCFLASEIVVTDEAACRTAFPYYGDTRTAAGAPLADDVLKCRLAPLDRAAYPVAFSDAQWARLVQAFPGGACDWSRPGVGQDEPHQTWTTFAEGPGGRPLGPAPVSRPLAGPQEQPPPRIVVLSGRADAVTGGDALVEVELPAGADPAGVRVDVDARDVTGQLALREDGRFLGRVTGLAVGPNVVTVRLGQRTGGARLTLTDHPLTGPVFSGPHVEPFVCGTEAAGLGPPTDADCSAPSRVDFFFRHAVTGAFEPYDPAAPPDPALVATTTTDQDRRLPYLVRRERAVIDRGIADIAVLWDPSDPTWEPWDRQAGWNGKLYYLFGPNCGPRYAQGAPQLDVLADRALSQGFMVATSTLNHMGMNCNDVTAAESLMMVKEHIVETYGEIRFTMGEGASGGSMQQHLIAANYPGLLDGIQPQASFPDIWTVVPEAVDCELLVGYFAAAPPELWADPTDRAAVSGHADIGPCTLWAERNDFGRIWLDPTVGCGGGVRGTPRGIYGPDNPGGVRCTLQDYNANVFGLRAADGFANRPWDNVGVQYGLRALQAGQISAEQFVDLNARVGGIDIDFNLTPERAAADEAALHAAYRTGKVLRGDHLDEVAIIDLRPDSSHEIHTNFHSWSTRERLLAANGHAGNQVILTGPSATPPDALQRSFDQLDAWLEAIEADGSADPLPARVVRARPADLQDACYVAGPVGVTEPAACSTVYPAYGDPRIAAGAPLADDVLKCRLAPLDRGSYPVVFTDPQWARLVEAFPTGVCDWASPGVGQDEPLVAWASFTAGPGGQPLGPEPVSTPFGGR